MKAPIFLAFVFHSYKLFFMQIYNVQWTCCLFADTSLRDGLFHEYKKFGKVTSVTLKGERENRTAVVSFKK